MSFLRVIHDTLGVFRSYPQVPSEESTLSAQAVKRSHFGAVHPLCPGPGSFQPDHIYPHPDQPFQISSYLLHPRPGITDLRGKPVDYFMWQELFFIE